MQVIAVNSTRYGKAHLGIRLGKGTQRCSTARCLCGEQVSPHAIAVSISLAVLTPGTISASLSRHQRTKFSWMPAHAIHLAPACTTCFTCSFSVIFPAPTRKSGYSLWISRMASHAVSPVRSMASTPCFQYTREGNCVHRFAGLEDRHHSDAGNF